VHAAWLAGAAVLQVELAVRVAERVVRFRQLDIRPLRPEMQAVADLAPPPRDPPPARLLDRGRGDDAGGEGVGADEQKCAPPYRAGKTAHEIERREEVPADVERQVDDQVRRPVRRDLCAPRVEELGDREAVFILVGPELYVERLLLG